MNLTSTKKKAIKLAIVAVTALVAVNAAAMSFTYNAFADSYTVYSNDEYYSETTYIYSDSAYKDYNKQYGIDTQANSEIYSSHNLTSDNIQNKEFVAAVSKNIWVSESTQKSQLMTYNDINTLNQGQTPTTTNTSDPVDEIGNESTTYHRLTIQLCLYREDINGYYFIITNSSWKAEWVWAWQNAESAEEFSDDYICISWGGNKQIEAIFDVADGNYYGGQEINVRKELSDSKAGYVWRFREISGYLGKEAEKIMAAVMLNPETNYNLDTNVKLTYIHTYNQIDLSGKISLTFGKNIEAAAEVAIDVTENNWQIQLDTYGLIY